MLLSSSASGCLLPRCGLCGYFVTASILRCCCILHYYTVCVSVPGQLYVKVAEAHAHDERQKCSTANVVFSNVRFMAIFAGITDNDCIK